MWHTELPSWDLWNYKARRRELGPRHNFSRLHNIIYIALCPFIRLWGFIYLVTYFSHESSSSWLVLYKCIEWLMPWGWVYKTFFYTGRLNIVLQSDFPFSIYLMSFLSIPLSLSVSPTGFYFLPFSMLAPWLYTSLINIHIAQALPWETIKRLPCQLLFLCIIYRSFP